MKKNFSISFLLLLLCCSMAYLDCTKSSGSSTTTNPSGPTDKCKNVTCANGGACDTATGACVCPAGYQGATCEIVTRAKFLGNWTVTEKGSISTATTYTITIAAGTNAPDVTISNFYNFFTQPIKGYVVGDTLYIPNQALQGKVVFGIGPILSNTTYGPYGAISMCYEVIDTATNIPNDFGYYPPDLSNPSSWHK